MAKSRKKSRYPKKVLRIPDLKHSKHAVLNSLPAKTSQSSYEHAINEFISWYCSEPRLAFNRTVVWRYRFFLEQSNLAPSTINVRLAAVRRLAYEASDSGLLSPELAAGIARVKGAKRLGVRIGNWITADPGKVLIQSSTPDTLRGKRDRAILAMLLGCGLRRAEIVTVRTEDLQLREEHWVIADLVGKGRHVRTVPMPDWVKRAIDEWTMASGDPQRTWFPEMIQKLRLEWHESMPFPDLIALRDSLDSMLHEIRSTRNIRSPIVKCPKCGKVGPGAEPRVSVRAMILSLSRFKIADPERIKILEKQWVAYREENGLNLYGKADSGEPMRRDCFGSNAQ